MLLVFNSLCTLTLVECTLKKIRVKVECILFVLVLLLSMSILWESARSVELLEMAQKCDAMTADVSVKIKLTHGMKSRRAEPSSGWSMDHGGVVVVGAKRERNNARDELKSMSG